MVKRTGRRLLTECPKCKEELINIGYNSETKRYEKECPYCGLHFYRKKGIGYRWIQEDLLGGV